MRVGGFGGVDGLVNWLAANDVAAVVDATHPFAATMSTHAAVAAAARGIPLLRLLRPAWTQRAGDSWTRVPDLEGAARVLPALGARVFLTIGRQGVGAFADLDRQWFLIRSIEPPDPPLPSHHELLLARGPFSVDAELLVMSRHRVDVLVTKDSGGEATEAKIVAARIAGVPVLVVDRPAPPPGVTAVASTAEAMRWLRAQRDSRPGSRSNQARTARS